MRLEEIHIKNMKCLKTDLPLAPVQVITGPIGSGKTTFLNALELGLVGHVSDPHAPDKPTKRNLDIFRLATDGSDEMGVGLTFDDGQELERAWRRKDSAKGPSVSGSLSFTGQSADTLKNLGAAERELREWLRPSMFGLNVRLFPAMTAGKRREMVLDMLGGMEAPDERPLAEWLYERASAADRITDADQDALSTTIDTLVADSGENKPIIDRLRSIAAKALEVAKNARAEYAGIEKAIAELGAGEAEAVDTSRIPMLEKELEQLDGRIEALNKEIGAGQVTAARAAELRQTITDSEADESCFGRPCRGIWLGEEWSGCVAGKADTPDGLTDCPNCAGTGMPSSEYLAEAVSELEAAIAKAEAEYENLRREVGGKKREAKDILNAAEASERECHTLRQSVGEVTEMGEVGCPLCEEIKCPLDSNELRTVLNNAANAKAKKSTELRNQARRVGEEGDTISDKASEKAATQRRLSGLRPELKKDHVLARKHETAMAARIEAERELSETAETDLDMTEKELEGARSNRQKAQEALDSARSGSKQAEAHAQLGENREMLSCAIRCSETLAFAAGPRGLQGEILKERVGPLLDGINEILTEFDPTKTFWLELLDARGNEACAFGYSQEGLRVPMESASGGEQMLICLAVAIAMMRKDSRANLRVLLLDDIQTLNAPTPMAEGRQLPLEELIESAMRAIEKGWLDNVLLSGLVFEPPALTTATKDGETLLAWTELSQ